MLIHINPYKSILTQINLYQPMLITHPVWLGSYWSSTWVQEVTGRFGIDRSLMSFAGDKPTGPTSKASAAPLTCWEFLKFLDVMQLGGWNFDSWSTRGFSWFFQHGQWFKDDSESWMLQIFSTRKDQICAVLFISHEPCTFLLLRNHFVCFASFAGQLKGIVPRRGTCPSWRSRASWRFQEQIVPWIVGNWRLQQLNTPLASHATSDPRPFSVGKKTSLVWIDLICA